MLKPKLFTTLKNYTSKQFLADLSAGTIVGIVALPLAIAFGIASGVTPEKGLITAIIAGFIISFPVEAVFKSADQQELLCEESTELFSNMV